MVNYMLMIGADLENITNFQPQGGCDDPNFSYFFKEGGTVTMDFLCGFKFLGGCEPVDFIFGGGWKVESLAGTQYEDVDLSAGDFAEYDEKGECPVMISNLHFKFEVVKH